MMRAFLFAALVALAALSPFEARAVLPDEVLPNATLEARARALSRQLRCMVCQNQSIDDSDAPLARDLRVLVRERLTAGDTDEQVRDFLVARYGEFVLLSPRLTSSTALLWAAPLLVVLIGGVVVFFAAKRRRDVAGTVVLNAEEQRRLETLMEAQPASDKMNKL